MNNPFSCCNHIIPSMTDTEYMRFTGQMALPCVLILIIFFLAGFSPASHAATLDECISAALEHNPGVRAAVWRVDIAQAAIRKAESAWYPRVTASGNYSRTDNPAQAFMMELNQRDIDITDPAFDPRHPGDTDNLRLGLGIRYRIFDGGRTSLDRLMANYGGEAKDHWLAVARNELIYHVIRGYYGALQARALINVRRETIRSLEESLRMAEERLDAGTAVKSDVLQIEVQLASARDDMVRTANGLNIAVAALNTAIGADLATVENIVEPNQQTAPHPPETDMDAVEQHPEWHVAVSETRLGKTGVRRARREYSPTISAFGKMDWDSSVASDFERSYIAGIAVKWELFDGFHRSQTIVEAKARHKESLAEMQETLNQLRLALYEAHMLANDARERIAVTRRSVDHAGEALRITRERYEQGAADISELLNAQVGMTSSRVRNAVIHYDYLTALANIQRARGELVEKYELTEKQETMR